jgi:hypothetical protein|tara:strand:- start:103 stop:243 length:141 start_codon:yes stop_codon:yes gene_type:complete
MREVIRQHLEELPEAPHEIRVWWSKKKNHPYKIKKTLMSLNNENRY